jgi:hypothetical protein
LASFSGHLFGGAAVSSGAALAVYGLGWSGPQQIQILFLLGVAGGLLPDLDSDNSAAARAFFTLLGVASAFFVSVALIERLPVLELALVGAGVFLVARYGLFEVFARLTVHRGLWHSWLAAGFAALAVTNVSFHLAGFPAWESWLAGFFVAVGYLTHLCLDEIASVDLLGNRVKRSFGTALKPFSTSAPAASAGMFLAALVLAYTAPTLDPVLAAVSGLEEISLVPPDRDVTALESPRRP